MRHDAARHNASRPNTAAPASPLSEAVLLILLSLAEQPRHGYSILKDQDHSDTSEEQIEQREQVRYTFHSQIYVFFNGRIELRQGFVPRLDLRLAGPVTPSARVMSEN